MGVRVGTSVKSNRRKIYPRLQDPSCHNDRCLCHRTPVCLSHSKIVDESHMTRHDGNGTENYYLTCQQLRDNSHCFVDTRVYQNCIGNDQRAIKWPIYLLSIVKKNKKMGFGVWGHKVCKRMKTFCQRSLRRPSKTFCQRNNVVPIIRRKSHQSARL